MEDSGALLEPLKGGDPAPIRSGNRILALFGGELTAQVLLAHEDDELRVTGQLEEAIGDATDSTLRGAVDRLADRGALEMGRFNGKGRPRETRLTQSGLELQEVVRALERWLELAPDRPLELGEPAAQQAVQALVGGWDAALVRHLAEGPLVISDYHRGLPGYSYTMLKRRLARMRAAGLVYPTGSGEEGEGTAYEASDWLRRAIVPIGAAARWEHRRDPAPVPISGNEVVTAFMLALPVIELPLDTSGRCTLAVGLTGGDRTAPPEIAAVDVTIEDGVVVSCRVGARSEPRSWALGTAREWLAAARKGRFMRLRHGSKGSHVASDVVAALPSILRIGEPAT